MRILFAGANRTLVGGTESYQRAAIAALVTRGHRVALLYERRPAPGAPLLDADAPDVSAWGAEEMGARAALERAADWGPEIAFVHGLASPSLEELVARSWPAVLFAHGYYGTCATGTKRYAFPHPEACHRQFGPGCLLHHYPRRCGGLGPLTMLSLYRRQSRRHAGLRQYRAILVASTHMRDEYLRNGIPREKIHVLPLPPTGIERTPKPPTPRQLTGRLVAVGRLAPLKGLAMLLDALAIAGRQLQRPLTLTVVGDGPDRAALERRARAKSIDARFVGWFEPTQRNAALRDADVLVLPSVWPEPWGLVGLEAACVGVPTVSFAWGGIPEWLAGGESGELAPANPPTADGLADAIVRALGDPAHHHRLSHGAWEGAGRYTMEQHLNELLTVFGTATR